MSRAVDRSSWKGWALGTLSLGAAAWLWLQPPDWLPWGDNPAPVPAVGAGAGPTPAKRAVADANARKQANRLGRRLYDEAWQVVARDFVDPTHNHQEWQRWRHRYDGLIQSPDDTRVAVETMLASLNDDYTRYLPPRDMAEQTMSIDSRLFGVGLQIAVRQNRLMVVTPLDQTPAARAGLKPNDLITHINNHPTAGLSVEEAADRIRGPEGSEVRLRLKRGEEAWTVALTRAEIHIQSVFTRPMADPGIGYLRLSSFISENLTDEFRTAFRQMGPKRAYIMDLRGNYGGLLSNALEVADFFLDQGAIVSIEGREGDRRVYQAVPGQLSRAPLVLLVDGGSASASEIVSGALKDHRRAKLIGMRTFGKGLVQKINPLPGGAGLNLTISRYLTPNGHDINLKGIAPDVAVPYTLLDAQKDRDPQLERAMALLKAETNTR